MNKTLLKTVLLVEDNSGDARLLREMFNEEGSRDIDLAHVGRVGEAEAYLAAHLVDIILLDLGLPDAQGLEAVRRVHIAAPHIPLVVLTGLDDELLGAQALQEGAEDYLIKGQLETRGLLRALRYAIERKMMEAALFAEKERAEVTLKSIGEAVICTDISGSITFFNVAAERTTGWSQQEAAGRPLGEVLRILGARSTDTIANRMKATDDPTAHLPTSCTLVRRDGLKIPIEDCAAPIHDRQGQPAGSVIVFRDVSAARAMAMEMTHSAEHDFLTGLPNRILLNDRIDQAIAVAKRHGKKVAVLFLDLDGFKHINDSLGHPIGDKLLQSIAKRLVACVRSSDTVSRQGGDEFVVLLAEVEQSEDAVMAVKRIVRAVEGTHSIDEHDLQVHAAVAARRMLHAVAEAHSIDRHDLYVTTSIGVSVYPDDGLDAETLIKNADTAMYQAKENGRQTYQFFTSAMNVRAVERQSIEEGLRRALERHELTLHYQPKIDLRTGAIAGTEALIRWMHPTRGSIPPAQFIPVAEDCGLILPIGAWVLRQACQQARAWMDAGLPETTMAVNISAIEFRDENFLQNLFSILSETRLDSRSLEIEVTESILMKHPEFAASTLRTLRERGITVAIDDFGTGYSSLSYLRKFPVDTLKIDQSFIRQISAVGEDTAIVIAVINMARNLRLRVVAEGVETLEELEFLRENQCDEAQGYYFSRPVPPEQCADLLRTGIPEVRRLRTILSAANAD
jgi:diguanylate cyclase (GGDEF)-like protein/PAS domain S-box-containing protein